MCEISNCFRDKVRHYKDKTPNRFDKKDREVDSGGWPDIVNYHLHA
jgi:hypothetical protein